MKKNTKNTRKNPEYKIITVEKPKCYAAEAYRRIKVGLDSMAFEKTPQVIQICSALPGDGKTTTLLNMAVSYAEIGKTVLMIDLDLRKPKIHRAFHTENVGGWTEYLTGNIPDVSDIVKHSNFKNIDYICAGPAPVRPSTLLSMERLQKTVEAFRDRYDIILVDNPPVLACPDCCMISRFCDGAVFQISRKNTDKRAARTAVKTLRQNGVKLLGCVLTEVDNDSEAYSYRYHYNYRY